MKSIGQAMAAVPRRLFMPPVVWADLGPGPWVRIDRIVEPAKWAEVADADIPLVTQFEDGRASGEGLATSSSSMPSMVTAFLDELEVYENDRVLEIGTGTGWTAALLCELVGQDNVTSVEIDGELAQQAIRSLKYAGYAPRVVTGDGAAGWLKDAPYDRVHVTCAVRDIPHAWLAQTRPGGVIACPYAQGFGYGHILRLHVLPNGSATGRFAGSADYMMLRSQRPVSGHVRRWAEGGGTITGSATSLDPRLLERAPAAADLMIGALTPGVVTRMYEAGDGSGECTFWLLDAAGPGGPWASVDYEPGKNTYEVQQAGDRKLWDETEAAYFRWLQAGQPDISRFGLTISPERQQLWLDEPWNTISFVGRRF